MSKKSKKQRAKARKAEVRRQSGITLRAVVPEPAGAKVLELKRAAPPEAVTAEPPLAPPPFVPDDLAEDGAEAAEARHAIAPAKLEPNDEKSENAKPSGETSPDASFVEQRTSQRVSVAVDIHLASESHFYSGLSGDISEGGLFVSTYRPLSVGSEVDVEFSLPGTERSVHARGEVRWIREHSAEQPRGVGIAFESLSDEDRDEIHSFCSSRPPLYYEDVG